MRQLLTTAATERIDNLHGFICEPMHREAAAQLFCSYGAEGRYHALNQEKLQALEQQDDAALEALLCAEPGAVQVHALELLWQRRGSDGWRNNFV